MKFWSGAFLIAFTLTGCILSKEAYLRPSAIWPYNTDAVDLVGYEYMDGGWKKSSKSFALSRAADGWFVFTSNDGKEASAEKIMFEELGGGFYIAMSPWSKGYYAYELLYRDSGSTAFYNWGLSSGSAYRKSRNLSEHKDVKLEDACLSKYSKSEAMKDSEGTIEVKERSALLGYMRTCARYVEEEHVVPYMRYDLRLK